jgi:hypothetical protein
MNFALTILVCTTNTEFHPTIKQFGRQRTHSTTIYFISCIHLKEAQDVFVLGHHYHSSPFA